MAADQLNPQAPPAQPKMLTGLIGALALLLALFQLYTAGFGVLSPLMQRAIHLLGMLLLCFLARPPGPPVLRWLPALLAALVTAYFLIELSPAKLLDRGIMGPSALDVVAGSLLVLLVLEATRRAVGLPIVLVALAFVLYAFGGHLLPAAAGHGGYDFERLSSYLVWTTEGVFGVPLAVSATFVAVFIIFGALLDKLGAGRFFIDLSLALAGRSRGGPAQTAVIASGLMGSISGSSVSNVVTTGAFTIPLMVRTGYSPLYAGAVEAVASTGGQIMPPVMGAAAFVMAEMLGQSYLAICLAALLPALLYFLSVGLMVYFRARRQDLGLASTERLPAIKQTLKNGGHLLLPLTVLVWLLVVQRFSPLRAGFFAVLALVAVEFVVSWLRTRTLPWQQVIAALKQGMLTSVPVALACAAAGLVIGVTSLTGLGVRFTYLVVTLADGSLILGSVLTMLACLVLGMGLPTTAAYVITAVLGAPALIDMGVTPLAAHMFIFYFAIISFITPPVAISAFAAAGVSGQKPMATAVVAFRLGLAGFLVPYLFIYSPALLMQGPLPDILLHGLTAVLGVAALAGALEGWFWGDMAWWRRLILGAAAAALIAPSLVAGVVGLLLLAITRLPLKRT